MSRRSEHTTKVFVGSLPPNVTADDLRQLFSPYGSIAECDIANRCGFLHLEDKDLAMKAIEELNNTTFMGGRISVEKGRVKPRGERRNMRNNMRGGPTGRKRDVGPYSRDGSYSRGPPRNGGYGRDDYNSYPDYRGDYQAPRVYDDGYDRRGMYDDRQAGGYMNDGSGYNNGYDRRPYDDRGYGDMSRGGYDDRRMAPTGGQGYDDRRAPMGDRRPLIDDQGMQGGMRQQMNSYDRAPPSNDMYSRRGESANKPLTGGYDRPAPTSYTQSSYSTPAATNYGMGTQTASYNAQAQTGYTQPAVTGYGDTRGQSMGYSDTRQQAAPITSGYGASQGYSATQSGGYGDSYNVRAPTNTYDTAYPPLPQQRGFTGGSGSAAGPHRDMPPARRY